MRTAQRVLVTTTRMPFAVEEVRRLGRAGHVVHAADTYRAAPGSHSQSVASRHIVPSPRYETGAFLARIAEIVATHRVDLVLPMFEEALYLARWPEYLGGAAAVFAPTFDVLVRLHDKVRFLDLARELRVDVPRSVVVSDSADLKRAIDESEQYFARPAYSRGGVFLLTNAGPLAGAVPLSKCRPTPQNPWVVQEFVDGLDLCTFSVARRGRIVAHSTYVHPKTIEHAGGIVFESVEDPRTLHVAQRFVEATGYEGQVSFDFRDTRRGLVAIECNPRPSAGVTIMPPRMFIDAIFGPISRAPRVAPAGARRHITSALLRGMVLDWREIRSTLEELRSGTRDVYAVKGDRWPGLYQYQILSRLLRYRWRRRGHDRTRSDLIDSQFDDVAWDGEVPEAAEPAITSLPLGR